MRRLVSIDILRAIAILLMIQVHFVENLSPREASSEILYQLSALFGLLSAPLFTFLVGLSLWLWLRKEEALGNVGPEAGRFILRRGLYLFAGGLIFAVIIWLPREVFDWDVLTLIGAATLILLPLRRLRLGALVGLALLVLLISTPLRGLTDYDSHWVDREYVYQFTVKDVVLGFLLQGYFPLLPWLVYPVLGYATGEYFFKDGPEGYGVSWRMPLVGLALIALAWAGHCLRWRFSPVFSGLDALSFYPASMTFILWTLGWILLGLWGMYRWLDSRDSPAEGPVLSFFGRYSRFSLTTYIVHHAVTIWPILLLAALEGRGDPWWYYRDAVSTPVALLLALLFVAGFYVVLIFWDRRRKYSFEWFLRWLSSR
ncbi:MAG: heparan-alpha-glucosaminide N-acetyltransferase domain-containing protein [PVC group bacterium]